jgi:hypothetical protein
MSIHVIHVIFCHSCKFISFHVILRHYVILCHSMSFYVILCHRMSSYVISCHLMSFHVISCHFMSFHVISCHFMSFHVISCHSCHSCHVSFNFSGNSVKWGSGRWVKYVLGLLRQLRCRVKRKNRASIKNSRFDTKCDSNRFNNLHEEKVYDLQRNCK